MNRLYPSAVGRRLSRERGGERSSKGAFHARHVSVVFARLIGRTEHDVIDALGERRLALDRLVNSIVRDLHDRLLDDF